MVMRKNVSIVVNVETHDDYENEYSVLWLDEEEDSTFANHGYARNQLVKVTQ